MEGHLGCKLSGFLDGSTAGGFLFIGLLRQAEGVHYLVECVGVFINKVQKFGFESLTFYGNIAELLPFIVVSGFATRKVGNHSTEGCCQSTHVCAHAATTGSRTFAGSLITETGASEVDKFLLAVVFNQELDYFLFGIERFKVVETHTLDGHLHDFIFANAKAALLFGEVVLASVDKYAFGNETHNLATRYAEAAVGSTTAHFVKTEMHRSNLDRGDIHRNLGNAIVFDIPADGLGSLEGTGNHDGVSFFVLHDFATGLATFALRTAFFTHIKSHGVGAAGAGGVQIVIDGNEEVARTHLGGTSLCNMVIPLVGTEIGLPFFAS